MNGTQTERGALVCQAQLGRHNPGTRPFHELNVVARSGNGAT